MNTSLFEQEEFYRTAFSAYVKSAVDAVILIDDKGIIQLFNPAAEKMFGYRQEEVLGENVNVLMPNPYRQDHDAYLESYAKTGEKRIIGIGREVMGQRKDNSVFPIDLAISEMEVGGKKYFNGAVRDISHLKQTESEVIAQNKLLDTLFKMQKKFIAEKKSGEVFELLLNEILMITNSEYGFIGEIKSSEEGKPYLKTRAITNISWDEESRKFYEEGAPDGLEFHELDNLFGHTILTGEMIITNDPASHPKSKGIPKNHPDLKAYMGVPLFSGDELIGMVGVANREEGYDQEFAVKMQTVFSTCSNFIEACRTEQLRQEAEAALQISEERLRRSQNYANIGTWDWNIETGELHWSDRIAPLFGFPEGDLETTYENFLNSVHPDDRNMVTEAVSACVVEGKEYDIEHRCIWPDRTVRWLSEKGDVQRDESGEAVRMLGVVQDITDKKEAEINLVAAKEEAERANRTKSEFLSSMSHELRTPMNAILGFAQLMELDKGLTENQKQSIGEISKAGYHLLELINEVLDLARIEAGKLTVSMGPVEVKEVFDDCMKLILPMAKKYSVHVNYQPDDCKNNIVQADKTRLKQVILNLLSNAIKYNKPGGYVSVDCSTTKDKRLRVDIKDNGLGIDKMMQSALFTAFNRLGADSTSIEGTGIGLVITKNLVELMNGTIDFSSTLGEGSKFWIELPISSTVVTSGEYEIDDNSFMSMEGLKEREYSIVYIEDNDPNVRLVEGLFERHKNIKLFTANDGLAGITLCEKAIPDLILLDINLPDMNGIQILEKLRGIRNLKDRPVVAVSANAMEHDIEKGLSSGFDDYVVKPIEFPELLAVVQKHLTKSDSSKTE